MEIWCSVGMREFEKGPGVGSIGVMGGCDRSCGACKVGEQYPLP